MLYFLLKYFEFESICNCTNWVNMDGHNTESIFWGFIIHSFIENINKSLNRCKISNSPAFWILQFLLSNLFLLSFFLFENGFQFDCTGNNLLKCNWLLYSEKFFISIYISGPTSAPHQLRSFGPAVGFQLRDLDPFRRKMITNSNASANHSTNSNSNSNNNTSLDCQGQGYKPNAPQIQGKLQILTGVIDRKGVFINSLSGKPLERILNFLTHPLHTSIVKILTSIY